MDRLCLTDICGEGGSGYTLQVRNSSSSNTSCRISGVQHNKGLFLAHFTFHIPWHSQLRWMLCSSFMAEPTILATPAVDFPLESCACSPGPCLLSSSFRGCSWQWQPLLVLDPNFLLWQMKNKGWGSQFDRESRKGRVLVIGKHGSTPSLRESKERKQALQKHRKGEHHTIKEEW